MTIGIPKPPKRVQRGIARHLTNAQLGEHVEDPRVQQRRNAAKAKAEMSALVFGEQGGRCAICGKRMTPGGSPWTRMDLIHLVPLGRRATRWDTDHPLNQRPNLAGAHSEPCHRWLDSELTEEERAQAVERIKAGMLPSDGTGANRTGGGR